MSSGSTLKKKIANGQGGVPLTNAKQRAEAVDRLGRLEQLYDRLTKQLSEILPALNRTVQATAQRVDNTVTVVDALAELAGAEAVQAKVAEIAQKRIDAVANAQQAQLDVALAEGTMAPVSGPPSPKTLLVGTETAKGSDKAAPFFVPYEGLTPELQALFENAQVGQTIVDQDETLFRITGMYEPVEPVEAPAAPAGTQEQA